MSEDDSCVSPSRDGTVAALEAERDNWKAQAERLAADARRLDGEVRQVEVARDGTVAEDAKHATAQWIAQIQRERDEARAELAAVRDGTVAVEDVRAQTVAEIVAYFRNRPLGDPPFSVPIRPDVWAANVVEHEFSPASTGDREDGR